MKKKKIMATVVALSIVCSAAPPGITATALDTESNEFSATETEVSYVANDLTVPEIKILSDEVDNEETYGDLSYIACDDHVEITGCDESAIEIEIPAEINGLPVTIIGEMAFSKCSSLTSVIIPDSVTIIRSAAFWACSSLINIEIPDSVKIISEGAFDSCSSLERINIPEGITKIANSTFYDCKNLIDIVIPESVIYIGNNAFEGCKSLVSITLPENVVYIGKYAFRYCFSLENIVIPKGVKEILKDTFCSCSSLKSIKIPYGITYIGEYAFYNCETLNEIEIPESVTYIENYAFSNCENLEKLVIPNNITSINEGIVEGCDSLKELIIPDGVTYISERAFAYCKNLTSINIPDSVTYIGGSAFAGCKSLTSINIPDSVTEIEKYAFYYCLNLESINIPESVKKIGEYSFESCESLTSINIPDGITKIEKCTFWDCENLESISIPESVKEIGECAFRDCYSLKDISIPESVEKIGKSAFDSTKWIKEKRNENPLVIVNDILISGKTCEGNVVIPDNVISICGNAFENSNIESIVIPQGITTIGYCMFDNCSNLIEITIPDSVTKIENYAFNDCESLKTVHYTGSLTKYQLGSTEGNDYFIKALFGDIEEELKNSYEIIPLLEPFNNYFFVKTANVSPQSFRFVDKDSIYSENSTIVYCDDIFTDVKYTDGMRINDGYTFESFNTDGGDIVLQTKVNGEWVDSDITLTLPKLYDNCDYLINTYATEDNFFDNMDAVQKGFSSICLYGGSYILGDLVKRSDYYSISNSPHIDQSFYIQSPYTYENSKRLFASAIYPFIYDSLGFPSMMARVSERLDQSSSYTWSDSNHSAIEVTYNGETKSYGGQGSYKGQGISEDKISYFFSENELKEINLENVKQLLISYSEVEMEYEIPKINELTWEDVCNKVEDGAWISMIGTASVYLPIYSKSYAYLYKGNNNNYYSEDKKENGMKLYWYGSLKYASDAWVDGRYVDSYEKFAPGEMFEEHPESDIILYQVSVPDLKNYDTEYVYDSENDEYNRIYIDVEIDEILKTVKYEYDKQDKIWKADVSNYNTILKMTEQGAIDEKYLDMIQLTLEEVKEIGVDRNTNIIPNRYYIYDGKVEPGTEFDAANTTTSTTTTKPTTTTTTTSTTTAKPSTITSATTTNLTTMITTSTTTTETSVSEPEIMSGDVNGDRIIDLKDSILLRRYVAGWNVEIDETVADVNADGVIDLKDSILLRRYVAGWNITLL